MNNREAIEAIINTAVNTGLVAHHGELMLLGWAKSTSQDGPKVKFALAEDEDLSAFERATIKKGKRAGQRYIAVFFEIADNEMPVARADQWTPEEIEAIKKAGPGPIVLNRIEKPFGRYAAELYRLGWFFNPKVLEAIGSDEEYLAWIEKQPCCGQKHITVEPKIGDGLAGAYEEIKIVDHFGDVVAAHVRRIANGAGTSIKPPYSAIPLCHAHHSLQHQNGESAIGGKVWCDNQRDKFLKEWAASTLARTLGFPSMGFVQPEKLRVWALARDLESTLPACYREAR